MDKRHAGAFFILVLAALASGESVSYSAHSSPPNLSSTYSEKTQIPPWKPRPALGAQKTLILLVEFTDVRFTSSIQKISGLIDQVDKWFRTSSYEKMYIDYTIHERIVKLPETMAFYGAPKTGNQRGDDPERVTSYVLDAFNLASNISLKEYRHIMLIHAGGDEAETGNPNEIWSHCQCSGPMGEEDPENLASWFWRESGKITHVFWGVSTYSEDETWPVLAHEYAHSLGAQDLYVYGPDNYYETSGVGFWSMMDRGSDLTPPADLDGWNKYILGWVDGVVVKSPQGEYTLHTLDSAKDPKALLIEVEGTPDNYYFLHARRKAETDKALPSEGVVVFKIDATRERSYEGQELALINDANPDTPLECKRFSGGRRGDCQTTDAPYNERGKTYSFTYGPSSTKVVLNNDVFWDQDMGVAFLVQYVAGDAFKITFGRSKDEVISTSVITTTTQTTSAETGLGPSDAQTLTMVVVLAALLMLVVFAGLRAKARRAARPRPQAYPVYQVPKRAVTPPQIKYCVNCGAQLAMDSLYCTRCAARQP